MTRCGKDATVFDVRLYVSKNRNSTPSLVCRIPRLVANELGNPSLLRFCIGDGKVSVEGVAV